jgi:hypothetical protein
MSVVDRSSNLRAWCKGDFVAKATAVALGALGLPTIMH